MMIDHDLGVTRQASYDIKKIDADYFEEAVKLHDKPKIVSNWVMGELLKELKNANLDVKLSKVTPQELVDLIKLVDDDTLSHQNAKLVFEEMFRNGKKAEDVVAAGKIYELAAGKEIGILIEEGSG